jgi:hypothetical protein
MEASSAGMREYEDKGRWVKYWTHLSCWISPCYGPLSLGARFETYEPFVSLFSFFFRAAVNRGYRISGNGEYDCTGFICKHFRSTTCKSLWLLTLYTLNNLNFTSDRILGRTTDNKPSPYPNSKQRECYVIPTHILELHTRWTQKFIFKLSQFYLSWESKVCLLNSGFSGPEIWSDCDREE